MASAPLTNDPVEIPVPIGGRALVVSDLQLRAVASRHGRSPTAGQPPEPPGPADPLVRALGSWDGPGVLVLNGNTVDAGTGSVAAALDASTGVTGAVAGWAAKPGRTVVLLPGDRDAQLAWSAPDQEQVRTRLVARLALAVDLVVDTGSGPQRVRVEPGQRLDALAASGDPTNPASTPLGHHLRHEVVPAARGVGSGAAGSRGDWLDGIERLDDPAALPRLVASRLAYRTLGRRAWLLLVPLAVAIGLRVPALLLTRAASLAHGGSARITVLAAALVVELLLLVALAVAAVRRSWRALAGLSAGADGREPNRSARDLARDLVNDGYRGAVTGHTCRPELVDLGPGFYANSGCVADVLTEHPARIAGLGLPPAFLGRRQASWVELDAGADIHVRLLLARCDGLDATLLERAACRPPEGDAPAGDLPELVATYPAGVSWPPRPSGQLRKRRVRRLAGVIVALAGFISLISSFSEPLRDRIDAVRAFVPIVVPEAAAAVTTVAGLALLVLARGVRRGQRRAWAVTLALLLVTTVTHLVKGVDAEESLVALAIAAFLWVNRREFEAGSDRTPLRGGLLRWLVIVALTIAAGTLGIELGASIRRISLHLRHHRAVPFSIGWGRAVLATVERMVGVDRVALPRALAEFIDPALTAATVALALALLVLIFRPAVDRRRRSAAPAGDDLARARGVVARHGSGTLDYFALRPDKRFFFWGDSVVAHAVYGGVCLVSPDPVGPVTEREPVWRAFRSYVDEHGWALGGLGAGAEWLPVYRSTGMHDLYVGDEGVVPIGRFSLEGGRNKGLRQAVNRVARYGYTISFHDPSRLDADLRAALASVMTRSRRGDVERGFSMTLGRVFEPHDSGLLLAVVHGPPVEGSDGPGPPVAFCQYVPAPGIDGYSLDLMRRDGGEHPNGLIDFAVVRTIEHLRDEGRSGLGLNFATMRAVLAGESGDSVATRLQAWLLRRMGDSMQIESLWRFNAKFDPDWLPRYALYDAPENAMAVAIAIARAESFWELPVIGRFLVPSTGEAATGGAPVPAGADPACSDQPRGVTSAGSPRSPGSIR